MRPCLRSLVVGEWAPALRQGPPRRFAFAPPGVPHSLSVTLPVSRPLQGLSPSSHHAASTTTPPPGHQLRYNSGFIGKVMDQVKKDMESNPEMRKALEDMKSSPVTSASQRAWSQLEEGSDRLKEAYRRTGEVLGGAAQEGLESSRKRLADATDAHPTLGAAAEAMSKVSSGVGSVLNHIALRGREVIGKLSEEEDAKKKTEAWRQAMASQRGESGTAQATAAQEPAAESEARRPSGHEDEAEVRAADQYALMLSHESAWDRFGARLRDMPFLHNFYGNPMLGNLFGETEQAAALREMKVLDPEFRLPDLIATVEEVIAPHIVDSYLRGDAKTLKLQCGESAYAALAHSIKERETLKLTLDPSILVLRNVEMKGATRLSDEPPWFIFTFNVQQINCMRDKSDNVVIGAIDDIREVVYSVALCKHPDPAAEGLQYPWLVKEVAILGNAPSW